MSVRIDDWTLAQALADTLSPDQLHRTLDLYAKLSLPGIRCVRAVLPLETELMDLGKNSASGHAVMRRPIAAMLKPLRHKARNVATRLRGHALRRRGGRASRRAWRKTAALEIPSSRAIAAFDRVPQSLRSLVMRLAGQNGGVDQHAVAYALEVRRWAVGLQPADLGRRLALLGMGLVAICAGDDGRALDVADG